MANSKDLFAISVSNMEKLLDTCFTKYHYFIEHDGSINFQVTGWRKLNKELEIPCIYHFYACNSCIIQQPWKLLSQVSPLH